MPTQTFTPKKRQNPAWHTARVHGDSFEQKGRIRHCIVKNQLGPRLGPVAGHTSWASYSFQMQTIISHNVDARVRGPVNPLPRVCQQRPRGSFIRLTETVGPCTPSAHASQPVSCRFRPRHGQKKGNQTDTHARTPSQQRVLTPMHIGGWKKGAAKPRRGDTLRPRVTKHTFVAAESWESRGSACARLLDGELLRRPPPKPLINH